MQSIMREGRVLLLALIALIPTAALAVEEFENPLAVKGVPVTDFITLLTAFLGYVQGFLVILALVFVIVGALIYITSAGNDSRMESGKKTILFALIGLAIAIAAPLFLKEIGSILGWTGTPVADYGTPLTLTQVLTNVINFLLAIIGVVSLIMLIFGGFLYITSAGEPDRADTGKKILAYSILGLVVSLAALVIIRQVATFFQ